MNKDAFELLGSLADINRERLRQDSNAAHKIKLIKKMILKMYKEQSEENDKLSLKNRKLKEKVTALNEEIRSKQDRIDELECEEPKKKKSRQVKTEYDSDNPYDPTNPPDSKPEEADDPVYVVYEKETGTWEPIMESDPTPKWDWTDEDDVELANILADFLNKHKIPKKRLNYAELPFKIAILPKKEDYPLDGITWPMDCEYGYPDTEDDDSEDADTEDADTEDVESEEN